MIRRGLLAFAVLLLSASLAHAGVSFQRFTIPDPQGRPIEVGVWSPIGTTAAKRPLIVMSHGLGGHLSNHDDTAKALAAAGFVAAALTHTGDNWRTARLTAGDAAARPRELKLLLDYMLADWRDRDRLDASRVGAFGFSLGGFTVLTAAGGVPDLGAIARYCETRPAEFTCRVKPRSDAATQRQDGWTHDPRIKAVVVAAPALAFTFAPDGLAALCKPVQLWKAEHDEIVPEPNHADAVRAGLPTAPELHVVQGAGHFDFIAPCSATLAVHAPEICTSAPGFDRAAFHADFNREVVEFFRRTLAPAR